MAVNSNINLAMLRASNQPGRNQVAQQLARRLDLPCIDDSSQTSATVLLAVADDRLELRDHTPGKSPSTKSRSRSGGVSVDFSKFDLRSLAPSRLKKQPLIRAFGSQVRTIIDATAGLGQDAALLAMAGFNVIAIERSPIIAALLEDGLRRANEDEHLRAALGDRLRILHADAREFLAATRDRPDAVYIDPMFPPKRKKSALPSLAIRLVRAVVGDDEDAAELAATARTIALNRVVIKRPTHAPPLIDNPTASYEGKLARFDMHLAHRATLSRQKTT